MTEVGNEASCFLSCICNGVNPHSYRLQEAFIHHYQRLRPGFKGVIHVNFGEEDWILQSKICNTAGFKFAFKVALSVQDAMPDENLLESIHLHSFDMVAHALLERKKGALRNCYRSIDFPDRVRTLHYQKFGQVFKSQTQLDLQFNTTSTTF